MLLTTKNSVAKLNNLNNVMLDLVQYIGISNVSLSVALLVVYTTNLRDKSWNFLNKYLQGISFLYLSILVMSLTISSLQLYSLLPIFLYISLS
jgi:hypothetical protein